MAEHPLNGNATEGVEATEDHSIVCRPIYTGTSGIQMVINSLKKGTAEIRDLLLNECELIYECKICRSLHRSLVNFIAHKRTYCHQHCCESMKLFTELNLENEETIIVTPQSPPQNEHPPQSESEENTCLVSEDKLKLVSNNSTPSETINKIEEEKTNEECKVVASSPKIFVHHQRKTRHKTDIPNGNSGLNPTRSNSVAVNLYNNCAAHLKNRKAVRVETTIRLEPIATNPNAVFQSKVESSTTKQDSVTELPSTTPNATSNLTKDDKSAVSTETNDGNALPSTTPKSSLKCSGDKKSSCVKCGKRFKSMRKMAVHLQSVHATKRTYYTCPCCKTLFVQIWSCFRHLMRIHKKSKQQVDKMRKKIKAKAFQKSVDSESKPKSEKVKDVKIEEVKDKPNQEKKLLDTSTNATLIYQCNICQKAFSQKPSLDGHRSSCLTKQRAAAAAASLKAREEEQKLNGRELEDFGSSRNERPRRIVKKKLLHEDFVNSSYINIRTNSVNVPKKQEPSIDVTPVAIINNPESSHTIQDKLNDIIDSKKRQCLQCKQTFVTLSNARRHAAAHIGYYRFRCKKCDFKAYGRSQISGHILKTHVTHKTKVKVSDLDNLIVSVEDENEEDDAASDTPPPQAKKIRLEIEEKFSSKSPSLNSCLIITPKIKIEPTDYEAEHEEDDEELEEVEETKKYQGELKLNNKVSQSAQSSISHVLEQQDDKKLKVENDFAIEKSEEIVVEAKEKSAVIKEEKFEEPEEPTQQVVEKFEKPEEPTEQVVEKAIEKMEEQKEQLDEANVKMEVEPAAENEVLNNETEEKTSTSEELESSSSSSRVEQVIHCVNISDEEDEPVYMLEYTENTTERHESDCIMNFLIPEDHNYFSSFEVEQCSTSHNELLEAVESIIQ